MLVAGGRAQDEVAPQRFLYQDPLAVGARAGEEDMVAKVALGAAIVSVGL